MLAAIVGGLEGGAVQHVIHLRTQYLGPEELLVAAKIALTPRPAASRTSPARSTRRRRGCARPSPRPG